MGLFRRTRTDARPLAGGTVHRFDGPGTAWHNPASGQGTELDRQTYTEFLAGCDLDSQQVDDLTKNNAVARRVAEGPVKDSMRAGYYVRGTVGGQPVNVLVGGPEVEKEEEPDPVATWAKRFGVLGLTVQAHSQARAHGLALWVYGVDDNRKSSEPLDWLGLRELLWVKVVSRRNVAVEAWGTDWTKPRFEQPTHYRVTFPRSGTTAIFHWSRVEQWTGVELSDAQRAATQDDGGGSVFDLMWSQLLAYGVSHQQALAALDLLTQGVWSNDNLQRAVDSGNAASVQKHYEDQRIGGGLFGDYVVGKGESYSIVGRPVNGIELIMDRTRDALVVASDMPEPRILGAAPSSAGLNNETGGLMRAWYDHLQVEQPMTFGGPLTRLYAIASRAHNGPTGGVPILGLGIGWPKLWQLTELEQADVRVKNSLARVQDLGAQSITIPESRTDTTLGDEYKLTPQAALEAAQPEIAIEDIEIADDEDMPRGETPLSIAQAGTILGMKSGGTRSFIARKGVPLFKPGGHHRVFESHLREALRNSRVKPRGDARPRIPSKKSDRTLAAPSEDTIKAWLVAHISDRVKLRADQMAALKALESTYDYIRPPRDAVTVYRGLRNVSKGAVGGLTGATNPTRDKSWTTSADVAAKFASSEWTSADADPDRVGVVLVADASPSKLLLNFELLAKLEGVGDVHHDVWGEELSIAILDEREVLALGPLDVRTVKVVPMMSMAGGGKTNLVQDESS